MLTTDSLNRIETNQLKYKHITFNSGTSKTFLDEAMFSSEDTLSDFGFDQAYTNCLMLVKTVPDPIVEQGWCVHHKHIISDREYHNWAHPWHTHDKMVRTCFMLKPFILDVTSHAYEKHFEF